MKKIIYILIVLLVGCGGNCYAQGRVTRPGKQTTAPAKTSQPKQKSKPQTKQPSKANNAVTPVKINVSSPDGYYNNHGYIDLGLPSGTKWATCNIGSSAPEKLGTFYAWGETKPKSKYTPENSLYFGITPDGLLGTVYYGITSDGLIDIAIDSFVSDTPRNKCLAPEFDAAHINWGTNWRMPTLSDFEELVNHCTWQWVESPAGAIVTGPNGQSIFLPADTAPVYKGDPVGHYWTMESAGDPNNNTTSRSLIFNRGMHYTSLSNRHAGLNVRPVLQ